MRSSMKKRGEKMYTNLKNSLMRKGLSFNAAAKMLDMPEATFRTKVCERSFSVEEAFLIKDNLFPEMDFSYLFQRTAESSESA